MKMQKTGAQRLRPIKPQPRREREEERLMLIKHLRPRRVEYFKGVRL
jgi:hypothetical protein